MKHQKLKGLSFVLAVVLLASAFTGCSQKNAKTSAEKKVETITVWSGESHSKDAITKLVDEYNNTIGKEKGIKIEYTVKSGDYKNVIDMAIASDQAPDLFVSTDMKNQAKAGKLIPIEDLPGGKEYLASRSNSDAYASFIAKGFDGKVYTSPFNVTTIGLLYNKDLFKKAGIVDEKGEANPPKTLEEMRTYAKKITNVKEKEYGIALPLKWGGFADWEAIYPSVVSAGTLPYDRRKASFDYEVLRPYLEWLLQVKNDNSYFPGAEGLDNDPARAQFAEGRIGMKFAASWDIGVLNDQFPAKCDWGVAPIPVVAGKDGQYFQYMSTNTFAVVSASAKSKDLAKVFEVYKWFNDDAFLTKMYEEGKYIPYSANAIANAKTITAKKGWEEFASMVKTSAFVPYPPKVKVEGDAYAPVLMKVWTGTMTIDEAISGLNTRYNAALQKGIELGEIDMTLYKDESFDIRKK